MKKVIAFLLLTITVLSLLPSVLADYGTYTVQSYSPNGYCYLYDRPSSVNGRNLGRLENGEQVWVISYDSRGWYYVSCYRGTGYIHDYALTPGCSNTGVYAIVCSNSPKGYCYMYDEPSSTRGKNMGRYDNGSVIEIIDWYADTNYAKVYSPYTGKYGYIRKTSLSLCY